MRVHSIIHGSEVNGPGLRSVLWVQGCAIGCRGCWNQDTHSFDGDAGATVDATELASRIVRESAPGTVGVSISGGEPMHQGVSLVEFMSMIQALRPDWDIGLFTGYTLGELGAGDYDLRDRFPLLAAPQQARAALWSHSIRPRLTWLKAGRFDAQRVDTADRSDLPYRHAVSSANQTIWIWGRKYTHQDFRPLSVEVAIGSDGLTSITGYPIKGM